MQSEWAFCYTLMKREDMTVKISFSILSTSLVRTKAHSSKTGAGGGRKENKPLANGQLASL